MNPKLIVTHGKASCERIRLKLPTVVGRDKAAGLVVAHPTVSRKHCEIVNINGGLVLRDFGSANGTYVGKERVVEEALLRPGDEITIGPLTFRTEYEPEVELTSLEDLKAGRVKKRAKPAAVKKKPKVETPPDFDTADTMPPGSGIKAAAPPTPAADEPAFDPIGSDEPAFDPLADDDDLAFDLDMSKPADQTDSMFEPDGEAGTVTTTFEQMMKSESDSDVVKVGQSGVGLPPVAFDPLADEADTIRGTVAPIQKTVLMKPVEPAAPPEDDMFQSDDSPAAATAAPIAEAPVVGKPAGKAKAAKPAPKPGLFSRLFGKKAKPDAEPAAEKPVDKKSAAGKKPAQPVAAAPVESAPEFEAADEAPVAKAPPAPATPPAAAPKKKKKGGLNFDNVDTAPAAPAAIAPPPDTPAAGDDDLNDFFNQLGMK